MRKLVMTAILIILALPAAAVEIPFKDGSVIEVASYTVNGSYLTLEMPNGARVAYDVADIDLDALTLAEAAAAAGQPMAAPPESTTLGVTGSLQVPEEGATGGLTITDQHVKHVSGSGIAGPEDDENAETPAGEEGPPEGYTEGGNVLLNNVSVSPLDSGEWQVKGEVVNRSPDTVLDVRANLQAAMPEGDPWTASVGVSGMLGPDEKAAFTHTFATPAGAGEGWQPNIQVGVVWMKSETKLEPNYNRTAPHPSALPYDRGGTGGAEVRKEDVPL
jgi:hypothetical protein